MTASPEPFVMAVPEALLNDLQQRLALTRWPDEIPGSGWRYGASLAYIKDSYTTGSTSTTGVLRSVSLTLSHSTAYSWRILPYTTSISLGWDPRPCPCS
jgi:epoxide hydrolase-like protein